MDKQQKPKGWGTRYTLIFMCFILLTLNTAIRVNLSVAIVAMVLPGKDISSYSSKQSYTLNSLEQSENNETMGYECPFPSEDESDDESESLEKEGEFNWSAQQQGLLLGAFFYGFIVTLVPGGYLSEKFGPKWVIFASISGGILCTFLSPVTARKGGFGPFMALKITQGLFQGPIFSGTMSILSKWVPPSERSISSTIVWAGQDFGSATTLALSGYLAEEYGWIWDFYLLAIVGTIFCISWTFLIFDSPDDHPRISEEEKHYISKDMGQAKTRAKLPVPPYKKIVSSIPVWALILTFVCSAWGFHTLLTEIPTYLNNIQHIPLTAVSNFN